MQSVMKSHHKSVWIHTIKLGCLLFWSMWFALACMTNLFDFMNIFTLIPPDWRFRSNNYMLLSQVLSVYDTQNWLLNFLFFCNTVVQGAVAIIFFGAVFLYAFKREPWFYINLAFGLSMALWATYLVLEEVFIAYAFEATHMRLFMFEIIMLLMIHLLPED